MPNSSVEQIGEQFKYPRSIRLDVLSDRRLRVLRPITVELSRENGSVIASVPELQEFGHGVDASEAIEDLTRTLCELYFSLEAERERLGPDLQRVLTTLKAHITTAR